ncbi:MULTISPECIES: helix-turn-helix transcriptional regulator [unclassified Thioalkalivibrio]|uniref:helix-turn-helix transcriptional regulator n=1 Tax=unclassified Thioalkalivibrio TaxID=2621013 RepID=UPI00035C618E|nr:MULTISPECIES: helix-turn-helix transcriptional regulator [unclassified Thioalkalivibrio]
MPKGIRLDTQRLRELRQMEGVTQRRVALDTSSIAEEKMTAEQQRSRETTYQRIERTGRVTPKVAERIARYFGVDIDDIQGAHLKHSSRGTFGRLAGRIRVAIEHGMQDDTWLARVKALQEEDPERSDLFWLDHALDGDISAATFAAASYYEKFLLADHNEERNTLLSTLGISIPDHPESLSVDGHWFLLAPWMEEPGRIFLGTVNLLNSGVEPLLKKVSSTAIPRIHIEPINRDASGIRLLIFTATASSPHWIEIRRCLPATQEGPNGIRFPNLLSRDRKMLDIFIRDLLQRYSWTITDPEQPDPVCAPLSLVFNVLGQTPTTLDLPESNRLDAPFFDACVIKGPRVSLRHPLAHQICDDLLPKLESWLHQQEENGWTYTIDPSHNSPVLKLTLKKKNEFADLEIGLTNTPPQSEKGEKHHHHPWPIIERTLIIENLKSKNGERSC